jgi:filamentous hemagglutinin family protein
VTINQSSGRGIIDWNNFSIGYGGVVTFKNGSGATLNRVTGTQMSTILGSLTATGSVYLINPQGVLIGPGAHVNTGGISRPPHSTFQTPRFSPADRCFWQRQREQ